MDILILSHTIFFIILNKSMIIDKWLSLYSYCNLFIITIPSYFRCGLTGDNRTKMCFLSFVYINIGDWFEKSIQRNEWLDKRIDFFRITSVVNLQYSFFVDLSIDHVDELKQYMMLKLHHIYFLNVIYINQHLRNKLLSLIIELNHLV